MGKEQKHGGEQELEQGVDLEQEGDRGRSLVFK